MALVVFFVLAAVSRALATCDAIPGTIQSYRGALGSLNRPFAGPGDFVALRLSPACDGTAFSADADEHVVVVVFTPPNGPVNAMALAASCAPVDAALQACGQPPGRCLAANPADPVSAIQTFVGPGPISDRQLRFRFPDTDSLVDSPTDDHTLSGPARIAVLSAGAAIPCTLLTQDCSGQSGLLACVDNLFALDGSCGDTPHETFGHFTALPPPNDYQALCTDPVPPCTGTASEVRFTTDHDGNVLLPLDTRGVLVGQGVPIARLLRGSSNLEAFAGAGSPIRIPGNRFLESFSTNGRMLPPVFDPQRDATASAELTLFGSADAPQSVLRIARRSPRFLACSGGDNHDLPCFDSDDCAGASCEPATCSGGSNAGTGCSSDADCPGAECGVSLFDFATRYRASVGPVVVPRLSTDGICDGGARAGQACNSPADCNGELCVAYRLKAQDPVPLDGIVQTEAATTTMVPEALRGSDLNGDNDQIDEVVLLRGRANGAPIKIGVQDSLGRAGVRLRQLPFTYAAVASESGIVAFLEPEPFQGLGDANDDGDQLDTILRVYRIDAGGNATPAPGGLLVADAAPLINGRSVVVSGGLVFFRYSELADARHVTASLGAHPAYPPFTLSRDGLSVAFASASNTLVANDLNGTADVFVHDRSTLSSERASLPAPGVEAHDGQSAAPALSADATQVAFHSAAANLVAGDANEKTDVFVRHRVAGTLARASVSSGGAEANESSHALGLSADGNTLVFASAATNLVPGDISGHRDIFTRHLAAGTTERVSVATSGAEGNDDSLHAAVSEDGRYVAFDSFATNLVPGDANSDSDVFLRDRATARTEQVSLANRTNDGGDAYSGRPVLSADARFVAFQSLAANLTAGDTNGGYDIFVRDRLALATERISRPWPGTGDRTASRSWYPSLSADGRFVAFAGEGADLLAEAPPARESIYLHDRYTGLTQRVHTPSDELPQTTPTSPAISADGSTVAFFAAASAPGADPGGLRDLWIYAPDPLDTESDRNGDGDHTDTFLHVLSPHSGVVTNLGPALEVAVAGTDAAFLRPEAADGVDLNGDGDAADLVVHLSRAGAPAQNLGLAATTVALSSQGLAVLVPEAGQGGSDRNGDADAQDVVVAARRLDGAGGWNNLGQAADAVALAGDAVVFVTPESSQNDQDINGDLDHGDRCLQAYKAPQGMMPVANLAAEELVVGGNLVAFRSSEAAQRQDLNEDGDLNDHVLHVLDVGDGQIFNSRQAVTPCRLEACDPRFPYRVVGETVKFLTLESEQGQDLNGDRDSADLVLQTYNVAQARARTALALTLAMSPSRWVERTLRTADGVDAAPVSTLGAVSAGICTSDGKACATVDDCTSGACFVPPGGCILDLGVACDPRLPAPCGSQRYCQPVLGVVGEGSCRQRQNACLSDAQCTAPARCHGAEQSIQRLAAPLAGEGEGELFVSSGRCVENTNAPCDPQAPSSCATGSFCQALDSNPLLGTCRVAHDTCVADDQCPAATVCVKDLVVAAAADADGDGITDPFDNCSYSSNSAQEDADGDHVGDACDTLLEP